MIPVFEIFGKEFSAYMITALIGYLVVIYTMFKLAIKNKLDEYHILYMLLFAAIGILLGGHILYGITNFDLIINMFKNIGEISSFKEFMDNLTVIFGGSVFYGGMLGAVVISYIYLKRNNLNMGRYFSLAIMAIPLFHFFGRVGCFLSGCCYGVEWQHGITYHHALVDSANGVPRFPVQLVEAVFNLVLFFVLLHIYNKSKHKAKTVYLYFIAYPVCRFILEFLRGDEYRGFLFGLSTSQKISIILFFASFGLMIYRYKTFYKKSE